MSTTRPLIVVPGDDPVLLAGSPHLDRLREVAEVRLFDSRPADDEEKVRRLQGATVLLNSRGSVQWPGDVLRQLPDLKLIACCAIGFDCVDVPVANERGIAICNVPGRTATIVAEHALALLLGSARRLAWMTEQLKQGNWSGRLSTSLIGKRLGVLGTGNIGCEMIRLAKAIGMEVVAWSFHPSPEKAERLGFTYVEWDELFSTSHAVSVHVKLTDQSRGFVSGPEFALMQPGTLLVNTARGAIVDTTALIEALRSGQVGSAGLDVYDIEPLPSDHPLLRCEQVVLTPHSADQLPEGMDALAHGAVDNVLAFLQGEPQNVVNQPAT